MRPLRALASQAAGIAWLAGTTLALLAALLLSAWLWSAQPGSLPRALDWLQGWLQQPDGTRPLQVSDASGSLREGGRIGRLRWQRDGLEVELEGLELRWPASLWPDLLLRGELRLDALELDRLRVRDDSPASPDRAPPTDLLLPWLESVQLPLRVQRIDIAGQPAIALGPLQADYHYRTGPDTGPWHELQLHRLRWADGEYRLDARLQASAPLRLSAQLRGEVQALAPGGRRQALSASAQVDGALGGPDARLQLEADAWPADSSRPGAALRLQALVSPWATLPLPSATLELREIDLAAFWPQAPRTRLQGRWQAGSVAGDGARWQLGGDLRNLAAGPWQRNALPVQDLHAELAHAGGVWQVRALDASLIEGGRLQAQGRWDGRQLWLERAELALANARARASGRLGLHEQRLDGKLELALPGASVGLRSDSSGGEARLALSDLQRLQRWASRDLARWLPAATLDTLLPPPLRDQQLGGSSNLDASWSGPLQLDRLPRAWQAGLAIPSLQIQAGADRASPALHLVDWQLALDGRDGQVAIRVDGHASGSGWNGDARLLGQASLEREAPGRGAELVLQAAELRASDALRTLSASLGHDTRLRWQGGDALTLAAGRASLALAARNGKPAGPAAELAWEETRWSAGRLASRGRASGLTPGWIDLLLADPAQREGPLAQSGVAGDLALQAGWDLDLPLQSAQPDAARARARLEIGRSSGDLSLLLPDAAGGKPQPVGLGQASASLTLDGPDLRARLRWDSRLAGRLDAEFGTGLALPGPGRPGWSWPAAAPLSGRLQAALPRLELWSRLAPTGWRISGSLQADASLGGSRLKPEWQGQLQAGDLALRSQVDGLDFSGGELRATLSGDQIRLDSLQLRGAGGASGGLLLGSGSLRWLRAETAADQAPAPLLPVLALELEARQLRLLARADRRLTLSGRLAARSDGKLLDLSGRLQADQALFILTDEDRPTLGEDVVVRGRGQPPRPAAAPTLPLRLQLELGLGDDFQLRGQGLDTRLTGELRLDASPGHATPQLVGQLRTVRGRYRAWGQALEIEAGVLHFSGRYDNPVLDILALRPLADQRVGVKVGGTALAPRLQLYSDPELPESEKLAWLLLGRPASGAGAEAALLQQAALALLGGRGKAGDGGLPRALGLDEISFRGETQKADGSSSAAALTLGKRITRQLYLSYSRSVIGTTGTVAVLYDLTRQLTLRAKAGDDNALELVFTRQYDGRRAQPKPGAGATR